MKTFLCITAILFATVICAQDYCHLTNSNFREYQLFNETINTSAPDLKRMNAAIFYVTNEIRLKKRLTAVNYSNKLEQSAILHSSNMVTDKFFSHTNPKNKKHRDPNDRAKLYGITNPYLAENIIVGFLLQYKDNTPVIIEGPGEFYHGKTRHKLLPHTYLSLADELVDKWMHSKGHRENILSEHAVELGCGTAFYIDKAFNDMPSIKVTQNFQFYENTIIAQ